MTAQIVLPGSRIRFVTSIETVRGLPYAEDSTFKDGQEYLVISYSHWDNADSRVVPRVNLAPPGIIQGPLQHSDLTPTLYNISPDSGYIVADDLRNIQVEISGPAVIDVEGGFVDLALRRNFLPAVEGRPGFHPIAVELVKTGPEQISARLSGWANNAGIFQHEVPDIRYQGGRVRKKAIYNRFMLDVVAGGPNA